MFGGAGILWTIFFALVPGIHILPALLLVAVFTAFGALLFSRQVHWQGFIATFWRMLARNMATTFLLQYVILGLSMCAGLVLSLFDVSVFASEFSLSGAALLANQIAGFGIIAASIACSFLCNYFLAYRRSVESASARLALSLFLSIPCGGTLLPLCVIIQSLLPV